MSGLQTPSASFLKRPKWEGDGEDDVSQQERQNLPAPKRRSKAKLLTKSSETPTVAKPARPLHSVYAPPRVQHPSITSSRSVYCYERLNLIEEGSYGVVFRARDKQN